MDQGSHSRSPEDASGLARLYAKAVGLHAGIGLVVAHLLKPVQYDGLMSLLAEFTDPASR
jgi:hypothetical protein